MRSNLPYRMARISFVTSFCHALSRLRRTRGTCNRFVVVQRTRRSSKRSIKVLWKGMTVDPTRRQAGRFVVQDQIAHRHNSGVPRSCQVRHTASRLKAGTYILLYLRTNAHTFSGLALNEISVRCTSTTLKLQTVRTLPTSLSQKGFCERCL